MSADPLPVGTGSSTYCIHGQVVPHTVLPTAILRVFGLLAMLRYPLVQLTKRQCIARSLLQALIQQLSIAWIGWVCALTIIVIAEELVARRHTSFLLLPTIRHFVIEAILWMDGRMVIRIKLMELHLLVLLDRM